MRINDAIAYNARHAATPFIDQSTGDWVHPASAEGVAWVARQQRALGRSPGDLRSEGEVLTIDGMLGPKTRDAYERRFGRLAVRLHTEVSMPALVSRWGYDHAHESLDDDPDGMEWRQLDAAYEAYTADGTWESGALRLVARYSPKTGRFNRTPSSYISLDGVSLGLAHYVDRGAAELVSRTVKLNRCYANRVFGAELADDLAERRLDGLFLERGVEVEHQFRRSPLVAGWRYVSRTRPAMKLQADLWLHDKVNEGVTLARQHGWFSDLRGADGGKVLAACTRMANSGVGKARRYIRNARKKHGKRGAMRDLEAAFLLARKDGGYGKPDRWRMITSWAEFRGPAPETPWMG